MLKSIAIPVLLGCSILGGNAYGCDSVFQMKFESIGMGINNDALVETKVSLMVSKLKGQVIEFKESKSKGMEGETALCIAVDPTEESISEVKAKLHAIIIKSGDYRVHPISLKQVTSWSECLSR